MGGRREKTKVELLTPEQAAEALEIGRWKLYDLLCQGQLRSLPSTSSAPGMSASRPSRRWGTAATSSTSPPPQGLGLIETPWTKDFTDTAALVTARAPLRRVGHPDDIALAVLGLVHAPYITGEVLNVDGGANLL